MNVVTKPFQLEPGVMKAVAYRLMGPALLALAATYLAIGLLTCFLLGLLNVPCPPALPPILMLAPIAMMLMQPGAAVDQAMKSPLMQRFHHYEFTPDRLLIHRHGVVSTNLAHGDLWKVRRLERGLAIFLAPSSWFFVPAEAFASAGDLETVFESLKKNIQPHSAKQDWILGDGKPPDDARGADLNQNP